MWPGFRHKNMCLTVEMMIEVHTSVTVSSPCDAAVNIPCLRFIKIKAMKRSISKVTAVNFMAVQTTENANKDIDFF